jgi:hypothetical protein
VAEPQRAFQLAAQLRFGCATHQLANQRPGPPVDRYGNGHSSNLDLARRVGHEVTRLSIVVGRYQQRPAAARTVFDEVLIFTGARIHERLDWLTAVWTAAVGAAGFGFAHPTSVSHRAA